MMKHEAAKMIYVVCEAFVCGYFVCERDDRFVMREEKYMEPKVSAPDCVVDLLRYPPTQTLGWESL